MRKEITKYYEDIQFSILRIQHHMGGVKSFAEFQNNFTVYDAVERRISIIGEAIWQIDKMDKSAPISDKQK